MDMFNVMLRLIISFKGSFINSSFEFVANEKTNDYFGLMDCKSELDVKCKVLEWLSRTACKGNFYSEEYKNIKLRESIKNGINEFLKTNFNNDDMRLIYQKLGNRVRHNLTIKFIESEYDIKILKFED